MEVKTNRLFLVDTGAKISVIPRDSSNSIAAQAETPRVEKSSCIKTYGYRSFFFDLDENLAFLWVFIVTDLQCPIIGADVSQHFDVLVNAPCRKIINLQTLMTVTGSYVILNQITSQYA